MCCFDSRAHVATGHLSSVRAVLAYRTSHCINYKPSKLLDFKQGPAMEYSTGTVPYRTASYRYRTVPYGTIRYFIANLICSSGFFARANCEPSVLSIRNGISRTKWYSNVVWILRPFNFSFWFGVRACVRARLRTIYTRVSSYRGLFLYLLTRICNYPLDFFQNTNTWFLRIVLTIHLVDNLFFKFLVIAEESRLHVTHCTIANYTQNNVCLAYVDMFE
jgi:hypothetical protein